MAPDTSIGSPTMDPQHKQDQPTTPPNPQEDDDKITVTEVQEITFDFEALHHISRPATPEQAPTDASPPPVRYPETLGTLVEIRESEGKGLGMFAKKDILPGTCLLCELPLLVWEKFDPHAKVEGPEKLRTDAEDDSDSGVESLAPYEDAELDATIVAAVDMLPQEKQRIYWSLFWHVPPKYENGRGDVPWAVGERMILDCNSFSIMDDHAFGVFETSSRINHSCVPNSSYGWRDSVGRLMVWNRFKLLEGEEVTIDYGHSKRHLREVYGFDCNCGGCTDSD